jgi:hypothetical protein
MDFLSSGGRATAFPPFVELLIGCLLNPEGWVTRAIGGSSRRLELWMQIRATAYALTQLLAQLWQSFPLMAIAPWRKGAMITAGLFAQWLRMQFIGLPVRDAYDPKSGQFVMPFPERWNCGCRFAPRPMP